MSVINVNKSSGKKPVIIVTGCSSGIGLELAKKLYPIKSHRTVITVRKASLAEISARFPDTDTFLVRELDVTDDVMIYSLIQEISCAWGRIDTLVNNAAVCFRAVVEHMDVESELLQLKTNYLGPMALTRAVLPIMREQRCGQILNVSSVSGMLAMPTMGSYSASKHALEAASEALWYEARPFGIRVNLVQLGFVNSSSFKRVLLSKKAGVSLALGGPHSEYYRSMTPMIERLMSLSITSSEAIAEKILKLVRKPSQKLMIPLTPDAFLFSLLKKIVPTFIFQRLLYYFLPGSVKWGGQWKAADKATAA